MAIRIELDRENDGRWLADCTDTPGAMAYGGSRLEAISKALHIRDKVVLADLAGMSGERNGGKDV